jgi:hypothetical protein
MTCLTWLGACQQHDAPPTAKRAAAKSQIAQDISQIDIEVRLGVANKRIDELERKVGLLEDTPDKLDLELLTQRVTELELKASGNETSVLKIAPAPRIHRSADRATQAVGIVRQPPVKASELNLPELERRPQMATPPK